MHAVWERDGDGLVGWVGSRTPFRRAHLERTPYASCFYFVALRLDPWRVQAKSAAAMAAGRAVSGLARLTPPAAHAAFAQMTSTPIAHSSPVGTTSAACASQPVLLKGVE